MMRLWTGLTGLTLSISALAIGEDGQANRSKFDVVDGIIATSDGRPGTLMMRQIQAVEDDLSDVAVRQLDVIYGREYGLSLTMDVYRPIRGEPNRAGVIQIISGGLWSGPEYRRMPLFTRDIRVLLERGYMVFAVMHSSQPKFTFLEVADDVPRSVRFIRHYADRFGIRPDRIGMIGYSSGGHLALLAATAAADGKSGSDDPVDTESSCVQAVVAYFPNSDLLNYGEDGTLMSDHFRQQGLRMDSAFDFHKWDNGRCMFVPMSAQEVRAQFQELSPLSHVSPDDPPTLLFHGDRDELVPIQQSRKFERRMKGAGVHCELVVADGKGHGWQQPIGDERDRVAKWFHRYLVQREK